MSKVNIAQVRYASNGDVKVLPKKWGKKLQHRHQQHPLRNASAGKEGRAKMTNRDTFLDDVDTAKLSLESGTTTQKTIEDSVAVFECQPLRVELLIGGPDFSMWERVEWKRAVDGDVDSDWLTPQKFMPY